MNISSISMYVEQYRGGCEGALSGTGWVGPSSVSISVMLNQSLTELADDVDLHKI